MSDRIIVTDPSQFKAVFSILPKESRPPECQAPPETEPKAATLDLSSIVEPTLTNDCKVNFPVPIPNPFIPAASSSFSITFPDFPFRVFSQNGRVYVNGGNVLANGTSYPVAGKSFPMTGDYKVWVAANQCNQAPTSFDINKGNPKTNGWSSYPHQPCSCGQQFVELGSVDAAIPEVKNTWNGGDIEWPENQPCGLPFQVMQDSSSTVRVVAGKVFRSFSAHNNAHTQHEWVSCPDTVLTPPSADISYVFLPRELMGDAFPTWPVTRAPGITDSSVTAFEGVCLAMVVRTTTIDGAEHLKISQFHIGNVFSDNNFNIRDDGAIVGYKRALAPNTAETDADLSFKLVAGIGPVLHMWDDSGNEAKIDMSAMPEISVYDAAGNGVYLDIEGSVFAQKNPTSEYLSISGGNVSGISSTVEGKTFGWKKLQICDSSGNLRSFWYLGTDLE